jgi:hypothetical protein
VPAAPFSMQHRLSFASYRSLTQWSAMIRAIVSWLVVCLENNSVVGVVLGYGGVSASLGVSRTLAPGFERESLGA